MQHFPVVIIGAGQAGLATAYYLKKMKLEFIILEENDKIGDSWRKRWDSLHLFTPAKYDGLPGLNFPGDKNNLPGKDAMADYLEVYVKKFSFPVQLQSKVKRITESGDRFLIETSKGDITTQKVVIATGTHPVPKIPAFASQLSGNIHQIHSSQYKNAGLLPKGNVLVVGAGVSGVEIAVETSKLHKTYIAGKPTFHIPDQVFKYAGGLYWWFANHILTIQTPMGRKAKGHILHGGGPLISISVDELNLCGVQRFPRMKGVKEGYPEFEDGSMIQVATVIWATGFKPDFSWIDIKITDDTGWPLTKRGISLMKKGLFFTGMPFQFGLTSGLIGGVGRDAAYISKKIAAA